MLGQIANVLGPILIITAIGFAMRHADIGLDSGTLSTAVILVATPALIFSTLSSAEVGGDTLAAMALAALLCVTVSALLGIALLRLTGMSMRSFLPSLMLPNSGNMGLPLVLLAFGEAGLKLGVSYFFVVAVVQHSVGFSISAGALRLSHLARQPLIYAVLCGLAVVLLDLRVPTMIADTADILAGMMIPAMLILLGGSLASLKVSDFAPALTIAIGRLVFGVTSAVAVIWALSLTGVPAGAVFLMATMPSAIVSYVFAERYRPDSGQVAGAVVVSTVLTYLALPGLLWAALWMAG